MTDDRWACLDRYVRTLADGLGLKDWQIIVARERPDGAPETALGASHIRWNSDHSTMWLPESTIENAEELRQTVLHELLHCHFERLRIAAKDAFRGHVSKDVWTTYRALASRVGEQAIERLAFAIEAHYPLIEWPDE